jgi:hypothetical protein
MANRMSDFWIKMNPWMKPLMNTPLHWIFSSRIVLVRFRGRKSGKEFVTPVGYNLFDDCIIIALSETHNRSWWKNYRQPWPMDIKYKGRWRSGEAVWIEPGSDEYVDRFNRIFKRDPFLAKIMKIDDFDREQGLQDHQVKILLDNTTGMVKYTDEEASRV